MPQGSWTMAHCTALARKQIGGQSFNPQYLPTELEEIDTFALSINWEVFKNQLAFDMYSGTGEITRRLAKYIKVATNDINSHFKADFDRDALLPQSYTDWIETFKIAITSVPFSLCDLAVPLLFHLLDISFIHVPSWYVCDANNNRHLWLADLAKNNQIVVINTAFARNTTLGRFCVLIAIAKDDELLKRAVKNSPFTLSIIMKR